MKQLPAEVLDEIFVLLLKIHKIHAPSPWSLDYKQDLTSCSLVCKHWYEPAWRTLRTHQVLTSKTHLRSYQEPNVDQMQQTCTFLALSLYSETVELAAGPARLACRGGPDHVGRAYITDQEVLAMVVQQCAALQELHFKTEATQPNKTCSLADILQACQSQLKRFYFSHPARTYWSTELHCLADLVSNNFLLDILPTLKNLQELHLEDAQVSNKLESPMDLSQLASRTLLKEALRSATKYADIKLRKLSLMNCAICGSDFISLMVSQATSLRSLSLVKLTGIGRVEFEQALKPVAANLYTLCMSLMPMYPFLTLLPYDASNEYECTSTLLYHQDLSVLMGLSQAVLPLCVNLRTLYLRDPRAVSADLNNLEHLEVFKVYIGPYGNGPLDVERLLGEDWLPKLKLLEVFTIDDPDTTMQARLEEELASAHFEWKVSYSASGDGPLKTWYIAAEDDVLPVA